ncbi:DHH family phosphoesterase [Corynebacterium ulceribovis]|uniref:DHH family phosphoesterase n=1 Tax=Corynebacterium ulceribovis TaxID=487732 RepID=UPI0003A18FEF|nr:bifunctional oligoribonuclease/PAP phosphatase NrnA [Corynebacterium ulceribovis]
MIAPVEGTTISRRNGAVLHEILDTINKAQKVVVICHVHADADAVGSATALALALRKAGRQVWHTYGENALLSKSLYSIPASDQFTPYAELPPVDEVDAVFVVDCGSIARTGALEDYVRNAKTSIVVDHHDSNDGFCDINLVDTEAESTTSLLFDLIEVWGIGLDRDIAHCLYAGLVTDTGSFRWGRPRMHTIAAKLLSFGLDPKLIATELLDGMKFDFFPMLGAAMSTATLVPEWGGGSGLIHVTVTHDMMSTVGHDEVEKVVDIVRTANDTDVTAVFKEYSPGVWRTSLRSQQLVDVAEIAEVFGGGGHTRASGYTFEGDRAALVQSLVEVVVPSTQ